MLLCIKEDRAGAVCPARRPHPSRRLSCLAESNAKPLPGFPPEPAELQPYPDRGRVLRRNHSAGNPAADAARGLPRRSERRAVRQPIHRHLGLLCHRPHRGGYLAPVEPVRTDGHPGDDPVGRTGLHDSHHPVLLGPTSAHRAVGAAGDGVHLEPE